MHSNVGKKIAFSMLKSTLASKKHTTAGDIRKLGNSLTTDISKFYRKIKSTFWCFATLPYSNTKVDFHSLVTQPFAFSKSSRLSAALKLFFQVWHVSQSEVLLV